jgi:hypothetical protein
MCTPIKGIKGYVLYISLPKFDFKLQIELANLDPTCYLKILISIDPDTLWTVFKKFETQTRLLSKQLHTRLTLVLT